MYIVAILLYILLLFPIGGILTIKNMPDWINSSGSLLDINIAMNDSVVAGEDSLASCNKLIQNVKDSVLAPLHDSARKKEAAKKLRSLLHGPTYPRVGGDSLNAAISISSDEINARKKRAANPLLIIIKYVLISSLIVGFFINLPYKKYLRKKRKGKKIQERLEKFCKSNILKTPIINASVLLLAYLAVHFYLHYELVQGHGMNDHVDEILAHKYFTLSLISSGLTVMFVYFWQKYRVQFAYITQFYSSDELKKSPFKRQNGKILKKMLASNIMTTFFPLAIVIFYITQSISVLTDLNLDVITYDQLKIALGKYVSLLSENDQIAHSAEAVPLPYVNTVDTVLLFVGISSGVFNALIYIFFFVKWTTASIVIPIRELLESMRRTETGETAVYSIVTTNDELGKLIEGYNDMSGRMHNYIEEISDMNKNLEKKVIERTFEIEKQKEEIESQRDEIEAQRDEIEAQRNMAIDQKDEILRQKEEMTESILYAKRIQMAMLPSADIIIKNFTDSFILFKPRDIVSGDFYWSDDWDDRLIVCAADCTGHGVPGALMSMIGIAYLNEISGNEEIQSAATVLNRLRYRVIQSLHQTGKDGEAKDGMDISLAIVAKDKKNDLYELNFAGAHNPLYYTVKEEGKCAINELKADRMPIGIYSAEMKDFTDHHVMLPAGTAFYLFSDGYADQFGGEKEKKLKYRKFREILAENAHKPMEEQKLILDEFHNHWKGNLEQIDDIVVIGMHLE